MNYEYEMMPLFKDHKIALSKKHRFTTDAVLLYDFSKTANIKRLCDLCSGTGVIAFLHNLKNPHPPAYTLAIEIDEEACFLIEKTIEQNCLSNMKVSNCDLREAARPSDEQLFDAITCNPPYFKENTGDMGKRFAARQESFCSMADVARASQRFLKYGGRLFLCHRPERLCDIFLELRKASIEPKKIRFARYSKGKEPFLVLVEGKKGAKPGIKLMEDLIIWENGQHTEEYKKLSAMN